ncbi:hypothetical protein HanPI659440_Chr08g0303851 [Helianthus annuus]|nr:hypothetical protein HanPI659440_Chr08g0303851 [Helianthus annuus]
MASPSLLDLQWLPVRPVTVRCSTDNLVLCRDYDWGAYGSCAVSAAHEGFAANWGLELGLDQKKKKNPNDPVRVKIRVRMMMRVRMSLEQNMMWSSRPREHRGTQDLSVKVVAFCL